MTHFKTIPNFFDNTMPILESVKVTADYTDTFGKDAESILGKKIKCFKLEHIDVLRNVYENGILDEVPNGKDLEFYIKAFNQNKGNKVS